MSLLRPFGFYAVLTNPVKGYEYLTEMFVAHRIRYIQLRMKKADKAVVLSMAEKLRKLTLGTESLFIVNDDPDIARLCEADGVHLGQDDLSFSEARQLLGPDKVIGLSTHNPIQVSTACALN